MTEKLKLPSDVVDTSWMDMDYLPYGTDKQEREYISPSEVSKESVKRIKNAKIGSKILDIFKSEQMAA